MQPPENFKLFIIFLENGNYMFEFDHEKLKTLFERNKVEGGKHSISKDRVFKIHGKIYAVKNLIFDSFTDGEKESYNCRLTVNICALKTNMAHKDIIDMPESFIREDTCHRNATKLEMDLLHKEESEN